MAAPDPWAEFNPQPVPATGLNIEPLPEKPRQPPIQTPAQAEKDQLEVEKLKKDLAPVADADQSEEAAHTTDILDQITHIRDLARKPGALGNLAAHSYFQAVPIVGQNAADLGANLNQIRGDLIQQGIARLKMLNGGESASSIARNKAEQQALADAAAALDQKQSYDSFVQNLDKAEGLYKRQLGRFVQKGLIDPETASKYGIVPETPKDNGITQSSPLPVVDVGPHLGLSTTEKAAVNPKVAAIAPQLTQYLNSDPKKVSNAMILGFVQKNGVDPSQWPELQDALDKRGKVQFVVDPHFNQPLTGTEKTRAELGASPGGALVAGIGDTATLGAVPEVAGAIGALDGQGYGAARKNFIDKQELLAAAHPRENLAGNLLGGLSTLAVAAPETFGKLVLQGGKQGGLYGALSSEDPSLGGRFDSGVRGGALGALSTALLAPALAGVARGGAGIVNAGRRTLGVPAEKIADEAATASLAAKMPTQDIPAARGRIAEQQALGIEPTGASALDRAGQDFLGRQASNSPAARETANKAVTQAEAALPEQLRGDFENAINTAANGDTGKFLNRPVREIASDIQDMAGREYEKGLAPIAKERLSLTPELSADLEHERVQGAIRDALANHQLDAPTRDELRTLVPQLRTLAGAPELAREAYAKGIPLSVDGARNIATALNRTANKLSDGSEGQVELSRLSRDIRSAIDAQYPEFGPVNQLYSSRMRAKEAMFEARRNFFASIPDKQDELAKASGRFTEEANPPEHGAEPQVTAGGFQKPAQPLPSNRQLAITGAGEAAVARAGEDAEGTARRIGSNPNQRTNNDLTLGSGAGTVQAKAQARASNLDLLKRIQSGGMQDGAESRGKQVLMAGVNLGRHFLPASAANILTAVKGVSSEDAARIVRLYTTPGKADALVGDLEKRYGYRKARFIISRIGALATTARSSKSRPSDAPPE